MQKTSAPVLQDIAIKVGRVSSLVMLALAALAIWSTFAIFHNELKLVSTPSMLILVFVLLAAGTYFHFRQDPNPTAGNLLLVLAVVTGLIGFMYFDTYAYYEGPGIIMLIVITSMALLPWRATPVIALLVFALLTVVALTQYPVLVVSNPLIDTPTIVLTRNGLVLAIGTFVATYFRYRVERDNASR